LLSPPGKFARYSSWLQ